MCFIQHPPEKSTGSTASQQKGSNHAGQEPCTFACTSCTSCTSCILFKAASKDSDAAIHKKRRHKQRAASLLASESLIQSKRADELISVSLRNVIKKITGNSLPCAIHFRKRCTLRMPASATRQELRRCTPAKPRCCKSASRFYSLERTSRLYSQKEGFDL